MIVVRCSDPLLRQAVCLCANVEEDVVTDAELAAEALQWRFPRLLIRAGSYIATKPPEDTPVLDLDDATLRRWEVERRSEEMPSPKLDFMVRRLEALVDASSASGMWVDTALADLSRAAGARLPAPLRSFARRVLEFP